MLNICGYNITSELLASIIGALVPFFFFCAFIIYFFVKLIDVIVIAITAIMDFIFQKECYDCGGKMIWSLQGEIDEIKHDLEEMRRKRARRIDLDKSK